MVLKVVGGAVLVLAAAWLVVHVVFAAVFAAAYAFPLLTGFALWAALITFAVRRHYHR